MASFILLLILFLMVVGFLNSPYLFKTSALLYGLFFGTLYFLFFPLLYLFLNGDLPSVSFFPLLRQIILEAQEDNLFVIFLYISGIFGVFVFLRITRNRKYTVANNSFSLSKELRIYVASIILYFCISLFILFSSGLLSGGHWYNTRTEYIAETGSVAIILLYLVWGLRLILVSYTFELLERKSINLFVAGLIFFIISFYEIFFIGNRIVVLMFGVAGFLFFIKRFGFYKGFLRLTLAIVLVSPIALFMAVFQNARHLIFTTPILEVLSYTINLILNTKTSELYQPILTIFEYVDLVTMLNIFEDIRNNLIQPTYGDTFLKIFTWIVPRSVWAAKPEGITLLVGRIYFPNSPGASLVPLIFGEFSFNFGILGPFFFPFLVFVILKAVSYFNSKVIFHNYMNFLIGFLFVRMPVSDVVIFIIFGALIYQALSFIFSLLSASAESK